MSGLQYTNSKWLALINKCLKDKPSYCKGFVNYLSDTSITTKYTYLTYVLNFIKYIDKDVSEITMDDFLDYMSYIEYKEDGEMTTPSYRIAQYSAIKKFCHYLYSTNRINSNYMEHVKRPKAYDTQKTIKKREIGYLTKKEIDKYINNVEFNYFSSRERQISDEWNKRDLVIIKVFLYTGIRCSALLKLDVTDIDLNKKELVVTDKGSKVKEYSIPESLLDDLKDWLTIRKDILYKKGIDEEALFISNRGCRMNQSSVSRIVNKYSDCIKGKNITPHKLRATYGTQLYEATKDVYFVQECMGHSNPKTTELYIRSKNENMKKASDIMDKIIN